MGEPAAGGVTSELDVLLAQARPGAGAAGPADRGHILGKLGAANRTEAVTRARELSLIP